MKTNKIIYWIATGLMTLVFTFSAGMYLFNYERASGFFESLGFPVWIVYPLAFAKILGLLAIWSGKSKLLKEWAYAGFFFDAVLAFFAHNAVSDGEWMPSVVAIAAVVVSRVFYNKAFVVAQKAQLA